ncbi:DNA-directed RNA polymerase III subunit RPC7-like isoform X2 [Daphnia pulicaria]|uniref:DNA-directed RNA polymerase III subunit RPC7-like isoform X2 n=1 Tax=Daphnia pulicaria TaxID=35523 RepID=UPI001EECC1E0|nr:DNA-directed RNA polymerase III subunit RPC7-like isoform X2 [Daphnia pulicaria]
MGGRGRGRGNAVSFNIEQLGFGRGEAGPVSVTQPPPLFPSLENRPLPLIKDVENEYILVTQKDLSTRMRNSPFYLKHSENTSYEKELPVLWNRMPAELRDDTFTKRLATGKSKVTLNAKRKKVEDPDKIFAKLEKKERNESEGDGDGDGKEDEDDQDKSDDEKVEMEDDVVEDEDEEMDKDTDYANNYFENGEGYLDDEEGQDDGEAQF